VIRDLFSVPYANRTGSVYDVFISYSQHDKAFAKQIQRSLDNFCRPAFGLRAIRTFRDEENLDADDLSVSIERALRNSDTLVLLASPTSRRSKWVRKELRKFCRNWRRLGERARICILLLKGTTPWTDGSGSLQDAECAINPRYAKFLLQKGVEPRVMDLRGAGASDGMLNPRNDSYQDAIASVCALVWNLDKAQVHGEQRRKKRQLRLAAASMMMAVGLIVGLAWWHSTRSSYELGVVTAFASLNRAESTASIDESIARLIELKRDPLIGLHKRLASDLNMLRTEAVVDVDGPVSILQVSDDGDRILVAYDHQNFGGSPDIEDIPNSISVALYQISNSTWVLKHTVGSEIGKYLYGEHIIALEAPHYVIIQRSRSDGNHQYERFSLKDGSRAELAQSIGKVHAERIEASRSRTFGLQRTNEFLTDVLSDSKLYKRHPNEGIDVAYGRRLVDNVYVLAPDRRTAIVGTYEGKMMLLDLAAALKRGEDSVDPVFAAAYEPKGEFAYVADESRIWRVDASGWPAVRERVMDLQKPGNASAKPELVLDATLSDEEGILAVATTRRLMVFFVARDRWVSWHLPTEIDRVAALRVDPGRRTVDLVTGKGAVVSGLYLDPARPLTVIDSSVGGEECVAWLDEEWAVAWLTKARPRDGDVEVVTVSLGDTKAHSSLSANLPAFDKHEYYKSAHGIRALVRAGDNMVLLFGDSKEYDSSAPNIDEQMLVIPFSGAKPGSSEVVFANRKAVDNLGEAHHSVTTIKKVMPGSSTLPVLAATDNGGIVVVRPGAKPRILDANLAARIHSDSYDAYMLELRNVGERVFLSIGHLTRDVRVEYQLPWGFEREPKYAAIRRGGRQIAIANETGELLLIDMSMSGLSAIRR
jgi:hypothetical protein